MNAIENKIDELYKASDPGKVESVLQEIGKMLVTEYDIIIGSVRVQPIWVEAYYYIGEDKKKDENNGYRDVAFFADPFVHGAEEQKEYKKLYFHHKTDDKRSGVDICLRKKDDGNKCYLSYLLKYSLVDNILLSQSQLSNVIRKEYDAVGKKIELKENHKDGIVGYTERIGLKTKDEDPIIEAKKIVYQQYKLAIVRDFDREYTINKKLPKKESLTESFLESYSGDKKKWCEDHLGYCPSKYKGK